MREKAGIAGVGRAGRDESHSDEAISLEGIGDQLAIAGFKDMEGLNDAREEDEVRKRKEGDRSGEAFEFWR